MLATNNKFSSRYKQVILSKDGVMQSFTVHRLVALVFIGPRPDGHEINHLDGNPSNNALSNLEYVTPIANRHHAFRVLHKDEHYNRKIPVSKHGSIVKRYLNGETQESIGSSFGTTSSPIRKILRAAGVGPKRKPA